MSLKRKLEKIGLTSESLDSIVQDVNDEAVANINRGGMKEQLEHLSMLGLSDQDIWKRIVSSQAESGASADVGDPKHDDSTHNASFTGTFVGVSTCGEYATVRDMEDNCFDVHFDEIDNYSMH